jgi:hypothetical protein
VWMARLVALQRRFEGERLGRIRNRKVSDKGIVSTSLDNEGTQVLWYQERRIQNTR